MPLFVHLRLHSVLLLIARCSGGRPRLARRVWSHRFPVAQGSNGTVVLLLVEGPRQISLVRTAAGLVQCRHLMVVGGAMRR